MRRIILLLVFALLAQGCGATPSPISTATSTAVPSAAPTITPTITIVPTATPPSMAIDRVLVVTFDGLRPDAITEAPMPNLIKLMQNGAYTLEARTISPTLTLPAHASIFSGLCPAQHGIYWDTTLLFKGYSLGVDVFDLAHAAGYRNVMIVGKDKLRQLAEPDTTDVFEVYSNEEKIVQAAIKQLPLGFGLMFLHFPSADVRGHKSGWMTNAQFKTLREADAALGEFITALDNSGLRETTLILVTADHGGHDRNHDGSQLADQLVPWVANGPGVQPLKITTPVQIMDTAATIAYALELPQQPEWAGIPVYQAFGLPQLAVHEGTVCNKK